MSKLRGNLRKVFTKSGPKTEFSKGAFAPGGDTDVREDDANLFPDPTLSADSEYAAPFAGQFDYPVYREDAPVWERQDALANPTLSGEDLAFVASIESQNRDKAQTASLLAQVVAHENVTAQTINLLTSDADDRLIPVWNAAAVNPTTTTDNLVQMWRSRADLFSTIAKSLAQEGTDEIRSAAGRGGENLELIAAALAHRPEAPELTGETWAEAAERFHVANVMYGIADH